MGMLFSTRDELNQAPDGTVLRDAAGVWVRKGVPCYPDRNPWFTFGSADAVTVQLPAETVDQ